MGGSGTGGQQAPRPGEAKAKMQLGVVVPTRTQKPEPTMGPVEGPPGLRKREWEYEGGDSVEQSKNDEQSESHRLQQISVREQRTIATAK